MPQSSAIELEQVSFRYGRVPVLTDIHLQVARGEFLAIIGPNGGGKTTLLKLMLGLLEPQSGTVRVEGQIGYVPQRLGYDPQFPISTQELVLSGRLQRSGWRYSRADRESASDALKQVGLGGKEKAPFRSLSGGQAQRALMARALVTQPDLLLLDESFAGIDAEGETQLLNLLATLRSQMTLVMVTHHLGTTIDRVDRVVAVENRITEMSRKEVCEHYALGLYHEPEGR